MNRKERRAINRANAALSTGPVTVEGKQAASANATTHGLTSLKPYLPAEEEEYKAYAADRVRRLRPESSLEHQLVTKIIDLEWRLLRIPWLESRLFANLEADPRATVKSLDTLSRHQLRLEKLLTQTIKEFWSFVELRRNRTTANALPENGFVLQKGKPMAAATTFRNDPEAFDAFDDDPEPQQTAAGA